jgi:hypothetical protein
MHLGDVLGSVPVAMPSEIVLLGLDDVVLDDIGHFAFSSGQ